MTSLQLAPGDSVAERYKLVKRVGKGAFGDIFIARGLAGKLHGKVLGCTRALAHNITLVCTCAAQLIAIKFERPSADELKTEGKLAEANRSVLKWEAVILKKLQAHDFV